MIRLEAEKWNGSFYLLGKLQNNEHSRKPLHLYTTIYPIFQHIQVYLLTLVSVSEKGEALGHNERS